MEDLSRPFSYQGVEVLTFKQLDRLNAVPKGTAFRAFKRRHAALTEGVDYFYVGTAEDPELLEGLRARGLLYPGVDHAVLVSAAGYAKLSVQSPG